MDWSGIATAYLDRERARLGLPTREQEAAARQARELAARTGESNLETAGINRDLLRAKIEALPAEQALSRENTQAMIDYRKSMVEKNERDPQARALTGPAAILAMTPEQQKAYLAFERQLAGARHIPGAEKPPARGTAIIRTQPDGSEVAFYPGTGESVPLPGGGKPTAQEQNRRAQAKIAHATAQDILAKLEPGQGGEESAAASEMGPFVGRFVTPVKQLVGGAKDATDMQTMLRSFASLLPILHGFRGGTQLQAEFERMAGNIAQNPQTVAQRVKALAHIADLIQQGASETDVQTAIDQVTQGGNPGGASAGADPLEGRTATGPNGELVIRKGGAWVPR